MSKTFDDILKHTQRPYLDRARARPFLKWAGGKRTLVPDIAKLLPETIETYWEPFLGGGAVFFSLDSRIRTARLSDVNAELTLTYQMARNKHEELIDLLAAHESQHQDKDYYYRVREATDCKGAVEVAARFIYLNKTCYNGLYRVNKSGRFNVPRGQYRIPRSATATGLRTQARSCRRRHSASATLTWWPQVHGISSTVILPTMEHLQATIPRASASPNSAVSETPL